MDDRDLMATLDAYVRHAETFGGLRDLWETARHELDPVELGELAVVLRAAAARKRPAGRRGRTVPVERFRLGHDETVALIERLIVAGACDVDICRFAGASQTMVGKVRRENGLDPHHSGQKQPANIGVIRNGNGNAKDRPSPAGEGLTSRSCAWCSKPLPAALRDGARYCVGGRCRQAAHRARQAEAA